MRSVTGVKTLFSLLASALAACAVPPPPSAGLADVMQRPAERTLLSAMRHYDDGSYGPAEALLRQALGLGLSSPRDQAMAHKHLAFILCTSDRLAACETAFRSARGADPAFALSRAESGHPVWGPVFKRLP